MKKIILKINNLIARYHYKNRHLRLLSMPRVWSIETTNYCNLQCAMCPRRVMTRKLGFMDYGLFCKIIKEIRWYTDFAWLHLYGEPLLHPQIVDFINYSALHGVKPGISTNALLLNEQMSSRLLNSRLSRIILCLDGVNEGVYNKLRYGGNFETAQRNIKDFFRMKKQAGKDMLRAELQIIRMRENEKEMADFTDTWKDIADKIVVKEFCRWGDQVEDIVTLDTRVIAYPPKRYPCMYLWIDGMVLWNGDVTFCCMDFDGKCAMGNLGKQKLRDIWNGDIAKRIRLENAVGNYSNTLCHNCIEWFGSKSDSLWPISELARRMYCYLRKLSGR